MTPGDPDGDDDVVHDGDGDELLDSRPAPQSRRWWMLGLLILAAVVVAAVLVQRGTSPHPTAENSASATATTAPAAPVYPAYSTGVPRAAPAPDVATRAPGACADTQRCASSTASRAVLTVIRSAIRNHFGRASDVRITALSTAPSGHPGGSVLFSRTITARVPTGRLTVLVSSSADDADSLSVADGPGSSATADSFLDGYYTHALLIQPHGTKDVPAQLAALDDLVDDPRLVTGRG